MLPHEASQVSSLGDHLLNWRQKLYDYIEKANITYKLHKIIILP